MKGGMSNGSPPSGDDPVDRPQRGVPSLETLVRSVLMTIPGQFACGARRPNHAGCGDIASVEVRGAQCPR